MADIDDAGDGAAADPGAPPDSDGRKVMGASKIGEATAVFRDTAAPTEDFLTVEDE